MWGHEGFIEQGEHPPLSKQSGRISTGAFGWAGITVQVILIGFFWPTDYNFSAETVFDETVTYGFLTSVLTLALVGMGYTYAYLRSYGLSSIGFSFFQVALGLQWALLVHGWSKQGTVALSFSIVDFMQASMGVLATLISFGVLAGKTSPVQTLVLTLFEIVCYFLNKALFLESSFLRFHDNGSTVSVCVFAAYFGLAASLVYGHAADALALAMARGSYHSELLGFLGTLFLWLNWPSLVGGSLEMGSVAQRTAIMNTTLALLASAVVSFAATTLPSKRLYTSLALASLSGGVAIGAVADFRVRPGGAALIGAAAGALSCWCFKAPCGNTLAFDTFNVHAVFGLPGLFGGLVSVLAPFVVPGCSLSAGHQLAGLLGTLVFACFAGAGSGFLLKLLSPPAVAYSDEAFWEPPEDMPKD